MFQVSSLLNSTPKLAPVSQFPNKQVSTYIVQHPVWFVFNSDWPWLIHSIQPSICKLWWNDPYDLKTDKRFTALKEFILRSGTHLFWWDLFQQLDDCSTTKTIQKNNIIDDGEFQFQ